MKIKQVVLEWTEEGVRAFELARRALSSDSILIMPDFEKLFVLATDASNYAYGAVLQQLVNEVLRPVAYYSKSLTLAQRNYSTSEREMLAVVMSVEHFHSYLFGRDFDIHTDHLPLVWIMHKRDKASRLARWTIRLANYTFRIIYKPGKDNGNADALSRLLDDELFEEDEVDNDDIVICVLLVDDDETLSGTMDTRVTEQQMDDDIN